MRGRGGGVRGREGRDEERNAAYRGITYSLPYSLQYNHDIEGAISLLVVVLIINGNNGFRFRFIGLGSLIQ